MTQRISPGLRKAIAVMGGMSAFARAMGVDRTAAYKWRRGVPAERVIAIESLTGVPRQELRPDLYGEPAGRTMTTTETWRSVRQTLEPIMARLRKLQRELGDDADNAALVAAALDALQRVRDNHLVMDDSPERQARVAGRWTWTMERYSKRFGEAPPLSHWQGSEEELDRLLDKAIATGRRLTVRRLSKVQSLPPAEAQ
jgi:DNA-binding transcriptional regulator YdaS (Cro superfamily)